MEHFVEFENVSKYYQTGSVRIAAADRLNFYVDKGEFCIIVGPVSYTHLTLPTKRIVEISVVGVIVKKKKKII